MQYLTSTHQPSPRHCKYGNGTVATQLLIDRGDTVTLAENDIYPHETAAGSAPLGYTDWTLVDGVYTREPAGTQQERDAAELQQRREAMQCTPIQGELALIAFGQQTGQDIIGGYDAWRTDPARTRLEKAWIEKTSVWKRLDPNVLAGAAAVGITDDNVLDQLFELAAML